METLARWHVCIFFLLFRHGHSAAGACKSAASSGRDEMGDACPFGDAQVELRQRKFKLEAQLHQVKREAPNILIIQPDDMYQPLVDWAGLGIPDMVVPAPPNIHPELYTAPTRVVPNIARLISEGTTFARAYTVSSMCSPSRAAVLTGRYGSRNVFMYNNTISKFGTGLDTWVGYARLVATDERKNIANYLGELGYFTGAIGKWHMTPAEETGASYSDSYDDQRQSVLARGFQYVDGLYVTNLDHDQSGHIVHNQEWITAKALDFMETALGRDVPFFLYFNPTVPHAPGLKQTLLVPPEAFSTPAGRLGSLPHLSSYCSSCSMISRYDAWIASVGGNYTDELNQQTNVSALAWIDSSIGVLYNYLSEKGALDSTYILFTTDHGDAKAVLYERGHRIPLIVRGPDVRSGVVLQNLVSNIDLVPTFLEWAGASSLDGVDTDGISWASLASGAATSLGRNHIFLEIDFDRGVVMQSGMKLIKAGTGIYANVGLGDYSSSIWPGFLEKYQLYNLTADPTEQINLRDESELHSDLLDLKRKIDTHINYTFNNLPFDNMMSSTWLAPESTAAAP